MKFYINEKKKQVGAWIENAEISIYNTLIHSYPFIDIEVLRIVAEEYGGKSFKAVAKCSPEDAFNPEFGKKLAASRALNKYYTALSMVHDYMYGILDEMSETSIERCCYYDKKLNSSSKLFKESN